MRKIVIIGGGIAGLNAATSAKETDQRAKITVISDEKLDPYRKTSLTKIIGGGSLNDIALFSEGKLRDITILKNSNVIEIDTDDRNVFLMEDGGIKKTIRFNSLIFSTGAITKFPSIDSVNYDSVCALDRYYDALKISKVNGNVTVIGAGFTSLMITDALIKKGIKVNLIIRSRALREIVEPEISRYIQKKMIDHGVNLLVGAIPKSVLRKNGKTYLLTSKGDLETSMIIFCTGVSPNIELAKKTGIKIGDRGIKTDEKMRTSIPYVYAAGDCAEVVDAITKKGAYIPIGSIAAKGGRIAGINAAGGDVTGDFFRIENQEIFGTHIVTMGYTEENAKKQIDGEVKKIKLNGAYVITDSNDKVIGTSCLYTRVASPYISSLFNAIKEEKTSSELSEMFSGFPKKINEIMGKGAFFDGWQ